MEHLVGPCAAGGHLQGQWSWQSLKGTLALLPCLVSQPASFSHGLGGWLHCTEHWSVHTSCSLLPLTWHPGSPVGQSALSAGVCLLACPRHPVRHANVVGAV